MEGLDTAGGAGPAPYAGAHTEVFPKLGGFRNLVVWQDADDLAAEVYRLTAGHEQGHHRLVDQMRAAAISVSANIAEGYGRGTSGDYLRFCEFTRGSLAELGSFLQYCSRTAIVTPEQLSPVVSLYGKTSYMLNQLIRSLREKHREGSWERGTREEFAGYAPESSPEHGGES